MSRYTFKVIRQGKVVAEATSMREAQKEALRVGGVAAQSALQNPAKRSRSSTRAHLDRLADTDFRAYHSMVMQAANIVGADEVQRITRGRGVSGATGAQLFLLIATAEQQTGKMLRPIK